MENEIIVRIHTIIDGYNWEKLEDAIADCIREFGVEGEVESKVTGNSVSVNKPNTTHRN